MSRHIRWDNCIRTQWLRQLSYDTVDGKITVGHNRQVSYTVDGRIISGYRLQDSYNKTQ